ncbi:MAG: hypothetical protein AB1505_08830 [Candidatus Latescibacterota bacterium]
MRYWLLVLVPVLAACTGGLLHGRPESGVRGRPALQVRFDSASASASLTWGRAPDAGFVRYEVQRSQGPGFSVLGVIEDPADTAFTDSGLRADIPYTYRVVTYMEAAGRRRASPGQAASGRIHPFVGSWQVEGAPRFLPTRLVVDGSGVLWVVGAGSGRLARFDRSGQALPAIVFSEQPLACLETAGLDGPALDVDARGCVHLAYSVQTPEGTIASFWSCYDAAGRLVWSRPLGGLFPRHLVVGPADRVFIESISQLQEFDRGGKRRAQHAVPALLVSSLRFWAGKFAVLVEPLQLVDGGWQAPRLAVYEQADRRSASLVIGRDPASEEDLGNGVLQRPTDFVVDEGSRRAFVVNAGAQRLEVFRDQEYLTRLGEAGSGPGQFSFSGTARVVENLQEATFASRPVVAGGITRDQDGSLYVADTFNNRIQKFGP